MNARRRIECEWYWDPHNIIRRQVYKIKQKITKKANVLADFQDPKSAKNVSFLNKSYYYYNNFMIG